MNEFVTRIRDLFDIKSFKMKCQVTAPDSWSLSIFHGNAAKQSVSTYENDTLGSIRYTPRQRFHIVMAGHYGYCFVAASQKDRYKLLSAFNGTFFPNKKKDDPVALVQFDLEYVRTFTDATRHPMMGFYPWSNLSLKFLKYCADAFGSDPQTYYFSAEDGFAKMDVNAYQWPKYVVEARIDCKIPKRKHAVTIGIFDQSGMINACITADTLSTVAELVTLCSGEEKLHQPLLSVDPIQMAFPFHG
jgi:hypothetical protein